MLFRRLRFGFPGLLCGFGAAIALQAQTPATFVAVTPCRLVDTRNATGSLGGPVLPGGTSRSFPLLSGSCGIPLTASAYLLNVTAVPSGPLGFLTIWPTGQTQPLASTINAWSGQTTANAATVPAGTDGAVSVYVSDTSNVVIDINGYYLLQTTSSTQGTALGLNASSAGQQNTAIGYGTLQVSSGSANTATGAFALSSNTAGSNNVAVGAYALDKNASGSANAAVGTQALLNNTIGLDNSALGYNALWANTTGEQNTAIGASALYMNATGSDETAIGYNALSSNTSGASNLAIGAGALSANTTGSGNIAIGYNAGSLVTTGPNNIDIGNQGSAGDAGVIRIGDPAAQSTAFVAGVYGVPLAGTSVVVSSTGQLGTNPSSRRYKQDIQNMDAASDALMELRPVTFRYKQPMADGTRPLEYGLIAEEVAQVYPNLVVTDADGKPQSVQYQQLPALLLNEYQKQHRKMEAQEQEIRDLETRIAELEQALGANTARAPK